MGDKEDKETIKKLEDEFHDFQKEWKKFLANDFAHLATNVQTLVKQNETIQQDMKSMEKKILEALGARAYDWQKTPPKKL